jgi:2-methylcitrate dehydratase PrpD
VSIESFTDARRFRDDIAGLLKKIELTQDESIPGDFHSMRVEIDVELEDGGKVQAVCRGPRGSWGVPMWPGDHEAKLRDCLALAMDGARATRLLDDLNRLESLDAAQVRAMLALLT